MIRKVFIGKYPQNGFEISLESVEPGKKFSETLWYRKAENAIVSNNPYNNSRPSLEDSFQLSPVDLRHA